MMRYECGTIISVDHVLGLLYLKKSNHGRYILKRLNRLDN